MKKSMEEQIKAKLLRLGKKNKVLRILMLPVLFISVTFFHICYYFKNNGKRMAMLAMTCFLFTVFSSFSFPAFVMGQDAEEHSLDVEGTQNVSLVQETEFNLEELELLDDDDVAEDSDYAGTSHGYALIDKYDADEILASTDNRKSQPEETQKSEKETNEEEQKFFREDAVIKASFSRDDWRLVLINKQNSIPDDYTFTLGTIKGNMQCDERIIDDIMDMLQAAKEDGVNLIICSPYRDMERQVMLFNRKITRYMKKGMSYMEAYQLASEAVTVPGASEHQIGLALDIVCNDYMTLDEGFGDTEAGKWLAENSCKYGFILRYPAGKEFITGIEYEPWHFRYVGSEAASLITEQGITLEEFWEEYL